MFSRDITTYKSHTLQYEFRNVRNRATAVEVLNLELKFITKAFKLQCKINGNT
jgi:hypothetical protein